MNRETGTPQIERKSRVRPTVIVFDVNETLSDMSALQAKFAEIGATDHLAKLWFATVLRDGFALAAAGSRATFAEIGDDLLRAMLSDVVLNRSMDSAVRHVMAGFSELTLHSDVPSGVQALTQAGFRLVTLSNGAAEVARALLTRGNILSAFEELLSVDNAPAWKPAEAAYAYVAKACDVDPHHMLLVAVHPWDIHGAHRAGLRTAWLNRTAQPYPRYFSAPDYTARTLTELAARLAVG